MKLWKEFWQEEDAVGVVEIILIYSGVNWSGIDFQRTAYQSCKEYLVEDYQTE